MAQASLLVARTALSAIRMAGAAARPTNPERRTCAAPTGVGNTVFDLGAAVVDPDSLGTGEPPTAVELAWTEQLVGDYDQNGEVNQGDLTPIAQYWQDTVQYDAASLHGGFALWPTGDPGSAGILPAMIWLKRAAGASHLSAASRASEDSCRLEGSAPRQAAAATEGQANWRKARVDGNGAVSNLASAKLGISGWVSTVLNDSLQDSKITVYPELIGVQPATGRIVSACQATIPEFTGTQTGGLWYLRQTDSGPWEMETVELPFDTPEAGSLVLDELLWDEFGQPIIMLRDFHTWHVWSAQRQSSGTWSVEDHYISSLEGYTTANDYRRGGAAEPGKFARLITERMSDKPGLIEGSEHLRYHVLFYDYGTWSFKYAGVDTSESYDQLNMILGVDQSDLRC